MTEGIETRNDSLLSSLRGSGAKRNDRSNLEALALTLDCFPPRRGRNDGKWSDLDLAGLAAFGEFDVEKSSL